LTALLTASKAKASCFSSEPSAKAAEQEAETSRRFQRGYRTCEEMLYSGSEEARS
jgi:hypothetical protein